MVEFLHSWVINIAVVIIFTTFLEILLPNSDMKRYVKVIIGLLVVLVIIKPFIMLKNIDFAFKNNIIEASSFIENEKASAIRSTTNRYQKEKALEIYKDSIEKHIKSVIAVKNEIGENEIIVNMDIDNNFESHNFGNIKKLEVDLKFKDESIVEVNKIQNIHIHNNKKVIKDDKPEYNLNDNNLSDEIEKELSQYLGLERSVITVRIHNKKPIDNNP